MAAVTVPAMFAIVAICMGHYITKWRVAKIASSETVEKRLARLEVAIDDMTNELARVVEGQQFVNKLLAEKSSEAGHAAR